MRYYSQHGEDKLIEEMLPEGFIGHAVDVGAGDGVIDSNTYYFEQKGWKVLCLEPSPAYASRCRNSRKLFLPVAAGREDLASAPFRVFTTGSIGGIGHGSLSGLRTDSRMEESFRNRQLVHCDYTVDVRVARLDTLLAELNFGPVDVLSVDTEGTELDVLEGLDWRSHRPRVVVVENNWDEQDVRKFMKTQGYRMWTRLAVNDFFVPEKDKRS